MDMDGLGEEPGQSKDKIEEEYYFEVSHASVSYVTSLPAGSSVTSAPFLSKRQAKKIPKYMAIKMQVPIIRSPVAFTRSDLSFTG